MLKLENINKDYGNGRGVQNLSFQIAKGKICGVLGSNGCGKTTTFRLLLNLLQPNTGQMTLDKAILDHSLFQKFGYVPEERSMLRNLTLKEQVYYLARLKKMNEQEMEDSYEYWIDYLHIRQYTNSKIIELSKGNQQKVQFLCALIHHPDIIIFDEPLNGLDINNVQLFKNLLLKLKQEKKIILISSHQYHNIEHYCDQIVYLQEGKIIFKGDIDRIKKRKKERIVKYRSKKDVLVKEDCILSYHRDKDYIVAIIKSYVQAKTFIQLLLSQDIEEVSLEYFSLHDIIKEKIK